LNKSKTLLFGSNPIGLFYKDSTFTFAIQPILGISYRYSKNGGIKHTWGGASMFGYIGKNLAFYTNLRDNDESKLLLKPEYINQLQGVPVKNFGADGLDYALSCGYIDAKAHKVLYEKHDWILEKVINMINHP